MKLLLAQVAIAIIGGGLLMAVFGHLNGEDPHNSRADEFDVLAIGLSAGLWAVELLLIVWGYAR